MGWCASYCDWAVTAAGARVGRASPRHGWLRGQLQWLLQCASGWVILEGASLTEAASQVGQDRSHSWGTLVLTVAACRVWQGRSCLAGAGCLGWVCMGILGE